MCELLRGGLFARYETIGSGSQRSIGLGGTIMSRCGQDLQLPASLAKFFNQFRPSAEFKVDDDQGWTEPADGFQRGERMALLAAQAQILLVVKGSCQVFPERRSRNHKDFPAS